VGRAFPDFQAERAPLLAPVLASFLPKGGKVFNSLKYMKKLEEAGSPREQAETKPVPLIVEGLRESPEKQRIFALC
jgi:hypothetical protein